MKARAISVVAALTALVAALAPLAEAGNRLP